MSQSGGRRSSSRLRQLSSAGSSPSSVVPHKRSEKEAQIDSDKPSSQSNGSGSKKRRQLGGTTSVVKLSKEEKLAKIITDFNMTLNELFHLTEYKSLVSWNPSDFSAPAQTEHNHQLPELFENFANNPKYKLPWNDGTDEEPDLSGVPLRLQKRVLAELEEKLLKKYPFKNDVIEKSKEMELTLINRTLDEDEKPTSQAQAHVQTQTSQANHSKTTSTSKSNSKTPASKGKQSTKGSSKVKAEQEEELVESSEEDIGTNYKLKAVKFTIPPPLVTHPSHIPAWRPEHSNLDNSTDIRNEDERQILEFNPTPITVIREKDRISVGPELSNKLHKFLESNYKVAIIDDVPDYNNTAEEFEKVTSQQEELLKEIYHKAEIENSLVLNGDKIERRKIVLPQTANIRQVSDPFRSTSTIVPKVQGAANNLTHHDHFLAQAVTFSKLHQQMRKQHQFRTRKVASMIESHFRKKRGEGERLDRERKQNLRRLSRIAVQAVKKRWTQANKVYTFIQQQKADELAQIKGREHLSQMLEHSTQLLEAQLNKSSREATTEVETDYNKSDDNASVSETSVSNSDDNFSTSSVENSDNEQDETEGPLDTSDEKNNDMSLSVEELRQKYSNLEESVEPSSAVSAEENDEGESSEMEDDDIDVSQGLSALYGGSAATLNGGREQTETPPVELEYSEEQKKLIEELNNDVQEDSVLNSEDSSSGLSSEESSDDADNEISDAEADQAEGEEELHQNGHVSSLASIFNGSVDQDAASEEEGTYSESEEVDSDDENMSSTDDENEIEEDKEVKSNGDIKVEAEAETKEHNEEIKEEEINGAKVRDVPLPPLLKGTLRPYQKQGLNWLASLYNNNTNGILADEMGLGKTIQTISLLSYLACEHHIWGPHLIIVPTSVMLNWEIEFKKFAPGFKVLTYYGSPQQRAQKRKGWNKPDAFHVCITSYQLVVQDQQSFKRRRWRYMILDEAHNIKNFRSTRWRALLNFNTENRLLLTGTPLQNNLMELWSLLYFLMPSSKVNQAMPDGFANLDDFQQWFGRPVDRIMEQTTAASNSDIIDENEGTTKKMDEETRNTVARLHQVLRPYLLRRLKKDVEKQMPGKYEHIVYCRLSKRQRFLYDDFMSRAKTKETLASGNFLSIINCLMQLRKVCNHPDLFEVRPIVTSFAMPKGVCSTFSATESLVRKELTDESLMQNVDFHVLNLDITSCDNLNYFVSSSANKLRSSRDIEQQIELLDKLIPGDFKQNAPDVTDCVEYYQFIKANDQMEVRDKLKHVLYLNSLRCGRSPIYGESLLRFLTKSKPKPDSNIYDSLFLSLNERVNSMSDVIEKYSVLTPTVVALDMKDQLIPISTQRKLVHEVATDRIENPFHKSQVKLSIAFPDKSLLQYDCGKLQKLAKLMQDLIAGGHRALIFTQMTKVLDILEQFLNIHGYRYMRLDGATKIEDRQLLTEKFNRDNKIPVFILSTRSGGLGINLTGADTVIFYDSDWNPAMDKQCQDRCHRIGQSRDVHIYRFVSEYTIESNILKKANQKRQLDNVVIQEGEFTTDYFGKFSVRDLVNDSTIVDQIPDRELDFTGDASMENAFAQVEDEDDRAAASVAMKEVAVDDEDFDEESKSVTATGTPTPGPDGSVPPAGVSAKSHAPGEVVDVDYEEGIGHIDEYMLRFISDGFLPD
ncbi:SNF2 family N-terminal domain-containing protein [Scheffersomyces xylosifermentans]|uniref:SNF2 family N-terminal domain-containing protein n=1 Tax=Scheffersomyces xylosifermentans TaxID=1304137 RepID=UPI00315C8017